MERSAAQEDARRLGALAQQKVCRSHAQKERGGFRIACGPRLEDLYGSSGRPGQDELIAYGPLLSDDGSTWLGTAALIRAPDPDAARAILTSGQYADIEVHNWQFGGRQ